MEWATDQKDQETTDERAHPSPLDTPVASGKPSSVTWRNPRENDRDVGGPTFIRYSAREAPTSNRGIVSNFNAADNSGMVCSFERFRSIQLRGGLSKSGMRRSTKNVQEVEFYLVGGARKGRRIPISSISRKSVMNYVSNNSVLCTCA